MSDIDVPTFLHLTYDDTTSSGSGGDPVQGRLNSEVFNASFAVVHRGMKKLKEENPLHYSLLLFYHTHTSTQGDRFLILKEMQKHFWQKVNSNGMHSGTVEKIPQLTNQVLSYTKAYLSGNQDKKTAIAKSLGISSDNWYRKDKKRGSWNQWFGMLVDFLKEEEIKAQTFMFPFCDEVRKEKRRVQGLSKDIKSKYEKLR